jgi:magnesium-transporting ATPase (P-type)
LRILEFTNERKCMSVIVQNLADNRIINFVKGADSSITGKIFELSDFDN